MRPLAMIEIERGDARALRRQRDRDVHRGGRLARAALFVGEDDDVRLLSCPCDNAVCILC